ncbi:hypothetical protein, partial [uncultured Desulfovibrio sp.]|uniref:hypothetical protein n=1 Tax=uncultured Desulfovibrio sp. TaxID=167968 RepID=UPI0026374644
WRSSAAGERGRATRTRAWHARLIPVRTSAALRRKNHAFPPLVPPCEKMPAAETEENICLADIFLSKML